VSAVCADVSSMIDLCNYFLNIQLPDMKFGMVCVLQFESKVS